MPDQPVFLELHEQALIAIAVDARIDLLKQMGRDSRSQTARRHMAHEIRMMCILRKFRPDHCEHGRPDGDWCPACHDAYALARKENDCYDDDPVF